MIGFHLFKQIQIKVPFYDISKSFNVGYYISAIYKNKFIEYSKASEKVDSFRGRNHTARFLACDN